MRMRYAASVLLFIFVLALLPQRSGASPADFACTTVTEIPEAECEVLVALYDVTDGANWVNNSGWLGDSTPCDWFGVTCNSPGSLPRNVNSIELTTNGLTGVIPPGLGSLSMLRSLGLGWNSLTGSIPSELGSLQNLIWLHLDNNQLSGSIPPELGDLDGLLWLNLAVNQLGGTVPPELGNLSGLVTLSLNGNQFTGSLPYELGSLTGLEEVYVHETQLGGSLPHNLATLTTPQTFWYHNTELCEPPTFVFQTWLESIPDLSGTGVLCDWSSLFIPLVLR